MADPIKPKQHTAEKKDRWWLVPAIAATKVPVITEINSSSGIYATCYLLDDQGGPTRTTNKVRLQKSLCADGAPERNAPPEYSMSDIVGIFDPQAAPNHNDKKLFEFLRDGFEGFAVRQQNKLNDTSDLIAAAGEFVDVVPVSIDSSWPDKTATGPEGFYVFRCSVAVTDDPAMNVAVVAAP